MWVRYIERVRFSDTPCYNRTLNATEHELSVQLYYTLAMLPQGRALDTCQTAGLGEGFETYRCLVAEYKPRLASRFVGTLTQLLSTRFSHDVEADIPAFEKVVRRYEQETGKGLDDQLAEGRDRHERCEGSRPQESPDSKLSQVEDICRPEGRAAGGSSHQSSFEHLTCSDGDWCSAIRASEGRRRWR